MQIALTVGVFDCFHRGHKALLEWMRENSMLTVIGVHDDQSTYLNKNHYTLQGVKERVFNLVTTGLADRVFVVTTADPSETLAAEITRLQKWGREVSGADAELIYVRGDDWSDFPGRSVVETLGVPVRLLPYTRGVSTTDVIFGARAKFNQT